MNSLRIENKKSILDNIICYENVDINKLDLLMNSSLLHETTSFLNEKLYDNEYKQLSKYRLNYNDGLIEVQYNKNSEYGRTQINKSLGLHNIRRQIRHTLSNEYYMDVDIVNMHPTLISQLMKKNGYTTKYLDEYINNREEIFKELIPLIKVEKKDKTKRDQIKTLFIIMMYGSNPEEFIKENEIIEVPEILTNFNKEMKSIQKIILKSNPEIENFVIKKNERKPKKNFSKNGAVMSYLAQEYEHQILTLIYEYCVEKGYIINNNVVLSNDGLMIKKELYKECLLNELNNLIKEKMDFDFKFINKEMNALYNDEFIYENITNKEVNKLNMEILELKKKNTEITETMKQPLLIDQMNFNMKLLNDNTKQINILLKEREKTIKKVIIQFNKEFNKENKQTLKIKEKIKQKKASREIINTFKPNNKYCDIFNHSYIKNLETYEEKKIYFELFVCKVLRPDVLFIFIEKNSDLNKQQCFYREKDLIIAFKELKSGMYDEKGIEIGFIKIWLVDENLKTYHNLDFIPYRLTKLNQGYPEGVPFNNKQHDINNNTYNLFNGYNEYIYTSYNKLIQKEIIQPFIDLGLSLCGDNQSHYEYFLNYIAHMIQKPNEKISIAFILKGKQGTGKNTFLDTIGNLINKQHYITSSKSDDFFGQYAEGFVKKLLVNLNEVESKDTFDYEGKIKSFISEDTITFNPKFVRSTTIRNISRLVITTNKPNPIKIDVKSCDRRFVVYQGSDRYLNPEYGTMFWRSLKERFNKPQFIAALYDFFNERDISKVDWRSDRPITEAYKQMCRLNVPIQALFLDDFINNKMDCKFDIHDTSSETINNDDDIIHIKLNEINTSYNAYCQKHGYLKQDDKGNPKRLRSQFEELELPFKYEIKREGIYITFSKNETNKYLKFKNYIERDEELDNFFLIENKGSKFINNDLDFD